jgi:hypothetical protein
MFKPPAISLLHPFHDPLASWHYLPKASSASNEEATQDLGAVPNTLGEEVGRQHALENVKPDLCPFTSADEGRLPPVSQGCNWL